VLNIYKHTLQHTQSGSFAKTSSLPACCVRLLILTSLVASLFLVFPLNAFADDEQISELQQRVEDTGSTYNEAVQRVETLAAQIAENTEKIAYLEQTIPSQQKKGERAMKALYKMNNDSGSLVNALLGQDDLKTFLKNFEYLTVIQNGYYSDLAQLKDMQQTLLTAQVQLVADKEEADEQLRIAEQALRDAQAARDQAQNEAIARAAAEAEEAAAAIEAARSQELDTDYGHEAVVEQANEPVVDEAINWSQDKASFVDEWGARIDSYLGGAPLGGYGRVFAEAAWEYGVDPRYSPAISCVESGKGAVCYRNYNAWGYGGISWSSWEEAIWAHVGGLSRNYHYTVCVEDAKMYCPPTWESWYSSVLGQINRI